MQNLQAQGQQVGPDAEKMVLNELIARELVAGDARKKKLDALPEVKAQVKLMQQQVLVDAWFADYFKKNPIKEEDVRNEYNRQLDSTKSGRNSNEYSVSQILLGSEQEAQEVSKRLENNESFERIAQDKSLDKPSAAQGGKLGWLLPSMIVKPLDDIVLKTYALIREVLQTTAADYRPRPPITCRLPPNKASGRRRHYSTLTTEKLLIPFFSPNSFIFSLGIP